jgi:sulfite reductase (NADPH) flavoprotein alpha-component
MTTALPLPQLHYAVLALGDSAYAQFCGFGRALDQWLQAQGAQPLFPRIEVNRSAGAAIAPVAPAAIWPAPAMRRTGARRRLKHGA